MSEFQLFDRVVCNITFLRNVWNSKSSEFDPRGRDGSFQKFLKFKKFLIIQGGGLSLIGNFSQIFPFFSDASPSHFCFFLHPPPPTPIGTLSKIFSIFKKIYAPWNEVSMIGAPWHFSNGFSRAFYVWTTLWNWNQAEKGPPTQKLKKIKCVFKWLFGKIQCF